MTDTSSLKDWADFLQSVAVIIASGVAIYGITAWRVEFVGKRKLELAEEVLVLFYQAKDAIDSIRSPWGFVGEGTTRKAQLDEDPRYKEAFDRAYVLIERYEKHAELFARIHALRYRFMAWFGKDSLSPFYALDKVVHELVVAARLKMSMAMEEKKDRAEWLRIERLYYAGGEDDPIPPRLNEIVSQIESICRPNIQ
jgi:hypothetical protein